MQIWEPRLSRKLLELESEIKNTIRRGKVLALGAIILPLGGVHAAQSPLT